MLPEEFDRDGEHYLVAYAQLSSLPKQPVASCLKLIRHAAAATNTKNIYAFRVTAHGGGEVLRTNFDDPQLDKLGESVVQPVMSVFLEASRRGAEVHMLDYLMSMHYETEDEHFDPSSGRWPPFFEMSVRINKLFPSEEKIHALAEQLAALMAENFDVAHGVVDIVSGPDASAGRCFSNAVSTTTTTDRAIDALLWRMIKVPPSKMVYRVGYMTLLDKYFTDILDKDGSAIEGFKKSSGHRAGHYAKKLTPNTTLFASTTEPLMCYLGDNAGRAMMGGEVQQYLCIAWLKKRLRENNLII